MVVPQYIVWEHGAIPANGFCVENGCATAMVGYALCFWFGFYCNPPYWCHSSNYQPGTISNIPVPSTIILMQSGKQQRFNILTLFFFFVVTLQQPGYDIIAQFMIGYVLPGKPIANLLFKIYGRISTVHALSFLSDLKLGHYMKIPPRCMYTAQVFCSFKSPNLSPYFIKKLSLLI